MEEKKIKRLVTKKRLSVAAAAVLALLCVMIFSFGAISADTPNVPDLSGDLNESGEQYVSFVAANVEYSEYMHIFYAFTCELDADMSVEDIRMLFWNGAQTDYTLSSDSIVYTAAPKATNETIKLGGEYIDKCVLFASYGIPATEIGDTVYARAYIEDSEGNVYYSDVSRYSVLQYVYSRFEDAENGYAVSDLQMNLYNAILRYGSAAQKVLGYKTDKLVSAKHVKLDVVGGVFSDGFKTGIFAVGDTVTAVARTPEAGEKFIGWRSSSGEQLGSSPVLTVTVDESTRSGDYIAVFGKQVGVSVVGGLLADGTDSGYVFTGETYTVTATVPDGKSFAYWMKNGVATDNSEPTVTVTEDEVLAGGVLWEAVFYNGTGAHFENLSSSDTVGGSSSPVVSGGYSVYCTPGTAAVGGFGANIVYDPKNAANTVLKGYKTATGANTGSTVLVATNTVGDATGENYAWGVLSADILLDSCKTETPMQISLGSAYRISLCRGGDTIRIYDSNSGNTTNFLGSIVDIGEWFNLTVRYKAGEVTLDENKNVLSNTIEAYVYVNGDLVAKSSNPRQWTKDTETNKYYPTHTNSYTRASFYLLNEESCEFYLDNVSSYVTNEDLTPTDVPDNIVNVGIPTAKSEWDNRYAEISAVFGDGSAEVIAALDKLSGIFNEDIYIWVAGLYDPETGAFYYSNSARDTFGYLPDIESTSQALTILNTLGVGSANSILTAEQKARLVAWVQMLQSNRDGYYYHPQWGTDIGASRQGRDLGNCNSIIGTHGGYGYLYDTVQYRLSGGKSGYTGDAAEYSYSGTAAVAMLTSPLSTSRVAAVSKVLATSETLTPTELNKFSSPEMFEAYLDWRWETYGHNTYSFGNYITAQNSQIKAKGEEYVKVCVDWFDELQESVQQKLVAAGKAKNGLWDTEVNYRSISALLKISSLYNGLGAEMNYPVEAINSAIAMMVRDVDAEVPEDAEEPKAFNIDGNGIVYVYNPPNAISNILGNLKSYNGSADAAAQRDAAHDLLKESAAEILSKNAEKLELFRKADGSYSYYVSKSAETSQGEPAAVPGANEGDVNATGLALGTRRAILGILEISLPILPSYEGCIDINGATTHLEYFKQLIAAKTDSTLKVFATQTSGEYDFEGDSPELPDKQSAAEISTATDGDNTYLVFKDASTAEGARLYFDSAKISCGANEPTYTFSLDMKYPSGNASGTNHQIGLLDVVYLNVKYASGGTLTFINRYYEGNKGASGLTENSQEISGSVNALEWFNVTITVYPERDEAANGFASLKVTQSGVTVIDAELRGRYLNSGDIELSRATLYGLQSSAATVYVDNVTATYFYKVVDIGNYHFDYSDAIPEGVTGGAVESEHDNHLAISGTDASAEFVAGVDGAAYTFNEFRADMIFDTYTASTAGTVALRDSLGRVIYALDLRVESDGTLTVIDAAQGIELISGVTLDGVVTLKIDYHYDISQLDVAVRYFDASGIAEVSAATVSGVTVTEASADASDYASAKISFTDTESVKILLDNLLVRNAK